MKPEDALDRVTALLKELLRIYVGKPHNRLAFVLAGIAAAIYLVNPLVYALGIFEPELAATLGSVSDLAVAASLAFGLLAVGIMVFGTLIERTTPRPPVIAVRHRSFDGAPNVLTDDDLRLEDRGRPIIEEEIDQTAFYSNGVLTDPGGALQLQRDLASHVRAHMRARSGTSVAYYGKAHIPFVFAAGFSLHTDVPVQFYELERTVDANWRSVKPGSGRDLGVATAVSEIGDGEDASIRISVSYPVSDSDVAERLVVRGSDHHIHVAEPGIDIVTHAGQVEAIAKAFREVLDGLARRPRTPSRIHVFCAAPMSVVFALGRALSPTIHAPVLVHNFSQAERPRYAWAVRINGGTTPVVELPHPQKEADRV